MTTRSSLVFLFATFAWLNISVAAETPLNVHTARKISTQGIARLEVAPDRVHLSVYIKVLGSTRKESGELVDATHQRLVEAMRKHGVAEPDIMLRLRRTRKEYRYEKERYVFQGYACREDLEIVVRDLATLNVITNQLEDLDDVQVDDVSFQSDRESEVKREALLHAAAAAREKAEALAASAGVKVSMLFELREIESEFESGGGWDDWGSASRSAGNYSGGAEPEHGVGTILITVRVDAVFGIE